MAQASQSVTESIPGVFETRQERSVRTRDQFLEAGLQALNQTRFADISVADLAKRTGNSVGSFYTRFEDKEAFFRALKARAIHANDLEINQRFTVAHLKTLSKGQTLDLMVDLLCDIFTNEYRGILRESLLRILDPDDPWEPMRQSARRIKSQLHQSLVGRFDHWSRDDTAIRLSFCFQLIVGVLQNDLVNDYHVFSTKDDSIRRGLKETVRRYMDLEPEDASGE